MEEVSKRLNDTLGNFGINGKSSEEIKARSVKTVQKIIDLVISDFSITAEAMSYKIGVTSRSIEKYVKILREQGILVHEGATKASKIPFLSSFSANSMDSLNECR